MVKLILIMIWQNKNGTMTEMNKTGHMENEITTKSGTTLKENV